MTGKEKPGQPANHQPNSAAPDIQPKRLSYDPEGRSVVMPDENGMLRYLYTDGSMDEGSTVDPRTPHALIAGRVVTETTVVPPVEDAMPTLGAQPLPNELSIERAA